MLNLDKTWFECTRFLFLRFETFEYIQNQIKQGYYVDDSKVGYLRPSTVGQTNYKRNVKIDGMTFEDDAKALSSLMSDDKYTLHEVMFGCTREYEVRRNIKLFDVSSIDDILSNLERIEVIHNQKVDACVERDIKFISLYIKKKRKEYGRYISSFVEKCQLEHIECERTKEKNQELRKQNSELRIEIQKLTQKLKTVEAQGDAQKLKKCAGDAVDSLIRAATLIKETYLRDE